MERHKNSLTTRRLFEKYYMSKQNPWHVTSNRVSLFKTKHKARIKKRSKKQQKRSRAINQTLKENLQGLQWRVDTIVCIGSKSKYSFMLRMLVAHRANLKSFKPQFYAYFLNMLQKITQKYITANVLDVKMDIIQRALNPKTSVRRTLLQCTKPIIRLSRKSGGVSLWQTSEKFQYFLKHFDRITSQGFIPTKSDLNYVPAHRLFIKNAASEISIKDGDQFIIHFTTLPRFNFKLLKRMQSTIVFCVTLADYAKPDAKYRSKLNRSVHEFKAIRAALSGPIMVILYTGNFDAMLSTTPFNTIFPSATGDVRKYIKRLFYGDDVYVCFFDKGKENWIFKATKDIMITNLLSIHGFGFSW